MPKKANVWITIGLSLHFTASRASKDNWEKREWFHKVWLIGKTQNDWKTKNKQEKQRFIMQIVRKVTRRKTIAVVLEFWIEFRKIWYSYVTDFVPKRGIDKRSIIRNIKLWPILKILVKALRNVRFRWIIWLNIFFFIFLIFFFICFSFFLWIRDRKVPTDNLQSMCIYQTFRWMNVWVL